MKKYLMSLTLLASLLFGGVSANASVWDTTGNDKVGPEPRAAEFVDGKWNWQYSKGVKSYLRYNAVYPGSSGGNYYRIDNGKFYWFGDEYSTSYRKSWHEAKPLPPDDLYGHSRESVNMYGYNQANANKNFGFLGNGHNTYWTHGSATKPTKWVSMGFWIKDVEANYFRMERRPKSRSLQISGHDYRSGMDYWIRPNRELTLSVKGIGQTNGNQGMALNDYINYTQVGYHGNDGSTALIPNWKSATVSDTVNQKYRVKSNTRSNSIGNTYVGWTAMDYETQFGVTFAKDGFDTTRIYASAWAENNYSVTGELGDRYRIRVDGTPPTFNYVSFSNDYDYLNVALNLEDSRSGVNRTKGGERNLVYIYPKGKPSYGWDNLWNVNVSSGSRHVRNNIPLATSLGNYSGDFTIEFKSVDNVGNIGYSQKYDLNRGQPELLTEGLNVSGQNYTGTIDGATHQIFSNNSAISITADTRVTNGSQYGRPDLNKITVTGLNGVGGAYWYNGSNLHGNSDANNTGWGRTTKSYSTIGSAGIRGIVNSTIYTSSGTSRKYEASSFGYKNFHGKDIYSNTIYRRYFGVDNCAPRATLEMVSNTRFKLHISDDYSGIKSIKLKDKNGKDLRHNTYSTHLKNTVLDYDMATLGYGNWNDKDRAWENTWEDLSLEVIDNVGNVYRVNYADMPFYHNFNYTTSLTNQGINITPKMIFDNSYSRFFDGSNRTTGNLKVKDTSGKVIRNQTQYGTGQKATSMDSYATLVRDTTHGNYGPTITFDKYNFTFKVKHTQDVNQTAYVGGGSKTRFNSSLDYREYPVVFKTGNSYTELVIKNEAGRVVDKLRVDDASSSIHMNRLDNGKYTVESTSYDKAGNPSPKTTTKIDLSWFTQDNYPVEITAIKDVRHKGVGYPIEVGENGSYYGSKSGQIKPKQGYYIDYRIKIPYDMLFTFDLYDVTIDHIYHEGTDKNKRVTLTAPPSTPSLNAEGVYYYPANKLKDGYLYGKMWIPPHAQISKPGDIGATIHLEFLRKGAGANDEANVRKDLPLVLFDTTSTSLQDIEVDKQR